VQAAAPEQDMQLHPVFLQAAEARAAWARHKRFKRRHYQRKHQQQVVDGWFSSCSRRVWRMLKGGQHTPCLLSDVDGWQQHFRELYGEPPGALQLTEEQQALKDSLISTFSRPGGEEAELLHMPYTQQHVEAAMCSLRPQKAHDIGGRTAELLRCVVVRGAPAPPAPLPGEMRVMDIQAEAECVAPHLVQCLVFVLNNLPVQYPPSLAVGRLLPVLKAQADGTAFGDHRGICVSAILAQLQDALLHQRAELYTDSKELRAVVQCGFRKQHGTLDALFTMQHLFSRQAHNKQPLYVCYVDFQKAFDRVRREEMLGRARQLGMEGPFLQALRVWFDNTVLAVDINGKQGQPFHTHRGTKQGSRLSPLLFGLFIEQLHELITLQLPGAGPLVEGVRIPDIMYADDIKLIACSAAELQQLLDVLHLFCVLFDMQVNVSPRKTCIVLYATAPAVQARAPFAWRLGDQVVPVCESYRDLGVMCVAAKRQVGRAGCMDSGVQALAAAGRKAMHALLSMCKRHHLVQPDIKLRLFDVLVEPVLSYACQVWGPFVFDGRLDKPLCTATEKVQLDFVRIMAGVGGTVKQELLLWDTLRTPIMWHWVALAVRFWARLAQPEAHGTLSAMALRSDVALMLAGCKQCWVFKLFNTLSHLGVLDRGLWQPGVAAQPTVQSILQIALQEEAVKLALRQKWEAPVTECWARQVDPRSADCPSDQVMCATYAAWVRHAERTPPHLKHMKLSYRQVQFISRYRLGWHGLTMQVGRHAHVPRAERVCPMCAAVHVENPFDSPYRDRLDGSVPLEDMRHFVVECGVLQQVREKFPKLFSPDAMPGGTADAHVQFVMNHGDQHQVVCALRCLHAHRARCLDLIASGQEEHMVPFDYIPEDVVVRRIMAHDNYDELTEEEQVLVWG
jgi:hypothetical protein